MRLGAVSPIPADPRARESGNVDSNAPSTQPDNDRLIERVVTCQPATTFAARLAAAITSIPTDRETFVVHDGLRGALVLGCAMTDKEKRFSKQQLVSLSRITFWALCRVSSAVVGGAGEEELLRPLVAAMTDAELLVTRLTAYVVDAPGAARPGSCTKVLEAELRSRRS